jgi:radical SAM-linked protein
VSRGRAQRQPSTAPPPPAVQKLALHYGKVGPLRFASHRVLQRAFERAVRRADLPIAYSAGFTPHPRLSYLGAAPTGAASQAEYLQLRLWQRMEPTAVVEALGRVLPRDLPLFEAVEWDDAARGDLTELLTDSRWHLEFPPWSGSGPEAQALEKAVIAFLKLDRYQAEQVRTGPAGGENRGRYNSKPPRLVDVRQAVRTMVPGVSQPADREGYAILDLVLRHATPAVRPEDVYAALLNVGLAAPVAHRATRLAQGRYTVETGTIQDPFSCGNPRP